MSDGHDVAERIEQDLLHAVASTQSVVVHLDPVIDGREPPELHAVTHHHTSLGARRDYLGSHRLLTS